MSYGFLCSLQVFFYIFAFISFFFYLKMHHSQAQSGLYSISFTHSLFICPTVNSEGSPTAFKQQLPSSLSSHSLASNSWLYRGSLQCDIRKLINLWTGRPAEDTIDGVCHWNLCVSFLNFSSKCFRFSFVI